MLPSIDTKPAISRKLLADLTTRTPWRWTSCGSCGIASCSLFCTCTWAMSGSVPGSKVRVSWAEPVASLDDDTKRSPSRPTMRCSMTCVTVSSSVLAEPPG
nr:hypothetical protein [Nannocystis pusilla]